MKVQPCPICGLETAEVGVGSALVVHCATCGRFTVPLANKLEQAASQASRPVRAYLAQYVRERYEEARSDVSDDVYADVDWGAAFQWARSQPVRNKFSPDAVSPSAAQNVERALVRRLVSQRARGYSVRLLRHTDYALMGTDSPEAFEALLQHMESRGTISRIASQEESRAWLVAVTGLGETLLIST